MFPRLVRANCPHCSFRIHVKPQDPVTTCKFCGRQSFVLSRMQPPPQRYPGTEHYGVIDLDATMTQQSKSFLLAIAIFAPVVLLGIVIAVVAMVVGFGSAARKVVPKATPAPPAISSPSR